MPIFLEKVILPLFVAIVVVVAITNPMKLDVVQRVTGAVAILMTAYFVAHTLHKKNQPNSLEITYSQHANIEIISLNFPSGVPSGMLSDPFRPGTPFFINVRLKKYWSRARNQIRRCMQDRDVLAVH